MMPIKEIRYVTGLNGKKYRANVCIDYQGRECVSTVFGYNLLSKDGKRVLKRQADWYRESRKEV